MILLQKNIKYIISLCAIALLSVVITPVFASEVTGTLTTGISNNDGFNGVVIAIPSASPVSGTYSSAQSITLSATNSSSIRYFLNTTDLNSALTCSTGALYTTPIDMSGSGLIRAIACYGTHASPLASFSYVINSATAPAPSGGGTSGGSGGGTYVPTTQNNFNRADVNDSGSVDLSDFNVLMINWGSTNATRATGDINGDGKVDLKDFNLLMINWSK